mmetsp:Transcript_27467/g.42334  ORF Transcript_27467/g.42334 Transcript_27467/m.42334 type:complete len:81 (-) Transcript_27467:138-380(-)
MRMLLQLPPSVGFSLRPQQTGVHEEPQLSPLYIHALFCTRPLALSLTIDSLHPQEAAIVKCFIALSILPLFPSLRARQVS